MTSAGRHLNGGEAARREEKGKMTITVEQGLRHIPPPRDDEARGPPDKYGASLGGQKTIIL